ncbi:hypothetical protein MIMGU_mgv1a026188mg, partial [Erythranthe guttata]
MSSSAEEASTKKTRAKSKSSKHISRSKRARLKFANHAVFRFFKKGRYDARLNAGAPVNLSDFLEYLAAQVLEIAGIKAKDTSKTQLHRGSAYTQQWDWMMSCASSSMVSRLQMQ